MIISVLILDAEIIGRGLVYEVLFQKDKKIKIVEAPNLEKAMAFVKACPPDIVIVDVSLLLGNGASFIEIGENDFELIITSTDNAFAITAFQANACAYLLKPIKKNELRDALAKALEKRCKWVSYAESRKLSTVESLLDKNLIITQQGALKLIGLKDLVYLEADNSYTTLFSSDGRRVLSSKPISYFEKTLPPHWFFRIHKSVIINFCYLKETVTDSTRSVRMKNGPILPVSRQRLPDLLERIWSITSIN